MIKMINDNILVSPILEETKTNSGIILAISEPKKTNKAKVISAPTNSEVKEGDVIIYDKYNIIALTDTECIIKEGDIIGIEVNDEKNKNTDIHRR